jgi:cyclic-di-GMP phosphodiesterase TipF (flagellum assembly factor)
MKVRLRGSIGIGTVLNVVAVLAAAVLMSLVPLDVLSLMHALLGVLAIGAAVAGGALLLRFRRERRASAAIDFVASRLLSVESRLSALDRPIEVNRPADLADITADITLLSGLIKSLAEAMTAQDNEINALRAQVERLTEERAAPIVPPAVVGRLPDPDRPARIASEIQGSERPLGGAAVTDIPPVTRAGSMVPQAAASASRVTPSLLPNLDEAATASRTRVEADPAASEARRAAIAEALDAERLELHLQPIVSLPQRRTRLYEVLARLRLADGTLLSPAEFMPSLERLGRLPQMDRAVVSRALAIAESLASRDSDVRLACNLSPATLRDPGMMGAIESLLVERADLAARLVFEIPQRAWRALPSDAAPRFDRMRALGIAFTLDHATDLRFDGIVLGEKGVTFIKLPADMLLEASRAGDDPGPIGQLLTLLGKRGVQVVVERVEREDAIPDLLDLDVAMAQGFALGAPRAVRADLALARGPSRAPAETPSMPEAAPAPEDEAPRPFRSFLRRTA